MTNQTTKDAATRMADCHPDREAYALDMCESCYRKAYFSDYNRQRYGEGLKVYHQKYEKTDKAKERRSRYYRVRTAIGAVLERPTPKLSEVFKNDEDLKKLQNALLRGHPTLTDIWLDLSQEQQDAINANLSTP
jgi:hypothetical protein